MDPGYTNDQRLSADNSPLPDVSDFRYLCLLFILLFCHFVAFYNLFSCYVDNVTFLFHHFLLLHQILSSIVKRREFCCGQVQGKLGDLAKSELIELIQQLERELVLREATLRDIVVSVY